MQIALYHNHYTHGHLDEVKAEMLKLGAPVIRAIWSECYGMWMAVEGCHRLRAAHALGLTPVILDVSGQKSVTVQCDGGGRKTWKVNALLTELNDDAWKATTLEFID